MTPIQLQMTAQGQQQVKLSWMGPLNRAYCVDRERLNAAGRSVREVLQNVADAYVSKDASYTPLLPALARAGERMIGALFDSSESRDSADEMRSFLSDLEKCTPLNIYSDSTVHIPWNFVFAGDPEVMRPPIGKEQDFDDFWARRFKIRVRFHQTALPPKSPIAKTRVKTLLALHQNRFKDATRALHDVPDLYAKIQRLIAHEVGVTNNWYDCRSKWRNMSNDDSILYIFAHSDGKSLSLRDEIPPDPFPDRDRYELDPNGFSVYFKKQKTASTNTLCFINGCKTADGDWGNGFLSVTSDHGFQGFIGSEAKIPNDAATRYAVEFLTALLEGGASVDEAYEYSRTACFPMSLWYSCYAYPDFKLSPS
jgi:hypothetical protein